MFTTRADTLFGTSYVVLAPEHPLVNEITTPEQASAVKEYREKTAKVNEIERLSTAREKSGVFTGAYAINPINGIKVPVWIADYVLYSYGTGAVMGVPSHDDRDFIFANKYNLPITRVIKGVDVNDELPFTGYGVMVNSGEFDGLTSEQGKTAIIDKLKQKGQRRTQSQLQIERLAGVKTALLGSSDTYNSLENAERYPYPKRICPLSFPTMWTSRLTENRRLSSMKDL